MPLFFVLCLSNDRQLVNDIRGCVQPTYLPFICGEVLPVISKTLNTYNAL